MTQRCELPECVGARLTPGNCPFTRECPLCGTVYASDISEGVTEEEWRALLGIDERDIAEILEGCGHGHERA